MKLLLDANLPPQIVGRLRDIYPDAKHVRSLSMSNASDTEIWNYAQREGYVIVSKDSDFYHRSTLLGFPPKIIWLQLGNCSVARFESVLRDNYSRIADFATDMTASFLILV
jgi:predicted nuclease of predicted toxin-antitoxin system